MTESRHESDINLRQFKEQVLSDYRLAFLGREMRRSAMVDADCHYVTALSDVAQVTLARFAGECDAYVSAGLDLTAELVRGSVTSPLFFSSLFSAAYDLYSHGAPNRLSVAVGMALADASARGAAAGEEGGRRVIVCTACGDFGSNGDFFESVSYAAARSLPLCIVLWNNNGSTSNGNLIRQLSGFCQSSGGRKTLNIEAAKGGDYAALCRVMRQQVETARRGCTTLTFVSGDDADVKAFGHWITEKQIATEEQLSEIESETRQQVERDRRGAYLSSLVADTPIRHPHRSLADISDLYALSPKPVMCMPAGAGAVNKAIGVAKAGFLPVVDASASDARSSLLASYPDDAVIVRSTDIEVGAFLASSPPSTNVYTPVTLAEAQGIYRELFSNPRQAIVLEPGFDAKCDLVPEASDMSASRLSEGEDVTLVSFGLATRHAADAVRLLSAQSLRVDHIHLTSLRPLDSAGLVSASLRKTKRLVVVDTDPSGLSAAAIISELALSGESFRHLMCPPVVVRPQSSLRPVEPHDICVEVARVVG